MLFVVFSYPGVAAVHVMVNNVLHAEWIYIPLLDVLVVSLDLLENLLRNWNSVDRELVADFLRKRTTLSCESV